MNHEKQNNEVDFKKEYIEQNSQVISILLESIATNTYWLYQVLNENCLSDNTTEAVQKQISLNQALITKAQSFIKRNTEIKALLVCQS